VADGRVIPTIVFRHRVPGLTEQALARFVRRAARAVGLRGMVTVLVTGDRQMRQLNYRFRGKDRPTDVLSFRPASAVAGVSGDIAISLDMASRNARRLGHSVAEEIRILVLHGILHLAGFDHDRDQGQMAEIELQLRRRLGLEIGLIERGAAADERGV
jgi:probable rRNA maturation factor